IDTLDCSAFYHFSQIAFRICLTNATSHRSAFRKRIAYTVTYHTIVVLFTVHLRQFGTQYSKAVASVEVVSIDNGKRFFDDVFTHQDSMVGSPGFYAVGRASEAFGQVVQCLEYEFHRNMIFVFTQNLFTEILLKIFTDNEYYFTKSTTNGVVNRIV